MGRDGADVMGREKQFVPLDLIVSPGLLHCQGASSLVIKPSQC